MLLKEDLQKIGLTNQVIHMLQKSFLRSYSLFLRWTYKLPAMVTNCSNNYGQRQHPEKLIPKLIYNILNGIDFHLWKRQEL